MLLSLRSSLIRNKEIPAELFVSCYPLGPKLQGWFHWNQSDVFGHETEYCLIHYFSDSKSGDLEFVLENQDLNNISYC